MIKKQAALSFLTAALLILFVMIASIVVPPEASMAEERALVLLSWLGVLLFVWSLITWYAIRKEVISPYIIFLCCSYLFMYGQSFLWAFGVEGIPDLRDKLPAYQIVRAQVFTLLALGLFHAGALYSAKKTSDMPDSVKPNDDKRTNLYKSIRIIGWILFVISIIPFSNIMINEVALTHSFGYGVLYDPDLARTGFRAIGRNIAQFFVPSLICLLIGYREKRLLVLAISMIIVIRVIVAFYVGGRTPAMVLILCAICIWHYFIRRISIRQGIILLILCYFLISLLPEIASVRSMSRPSFADYFSGLINSVGKNEQLIKAVSELGGSMFPLIQTMNLVPTQYPLRYGGSYIYSLFSLVPNLGFWEAHPAFKNANLGDWLQDTLGLGYGPGFSPSAEAYINFGWGGILVMFALGIFYGWAFTLIDRNSATHKPDLACLVFVLLFFLIPTTRNSFIVTVRAVFYFAVPIYVFAIILSRYGHKKRINNLNKDINRSGIES